MCYQVEVVVMCKGGSLCVGSKQSTRVELGRFYWKKHWILCERAMRCELRHNTRLPDPNNPNKDQSQRTPPECFEGSSTVVDACSRTTRTTRPLYAPRDWCSEVIYNANSRLFPFPQYCNSCKKANIDVVFQYGKELMGWNGSQLDSLFDRNDGESRANRYLLACWEIAEYKKWKEMAASTPGRMMWHSTALDPEATAEELVRLLEDPTLKAGAERRRRQVD